MHTLKLKKKIHNADNQFLIIYYIHDRPLSTLCISGYTEKLLTHQQVALSLFEETQVGHSYPRDTEQDEFITQTLLFIFKLYTLQLKRDSGLLTWEFFLSCSDCCLEKGPLGIPE